FAQSYALEASSGKLLNLALCHETLGKTATAWAEYRAAARLARNEARADRAAAADGKAAALEPKLPRLTTVAAAPVPGLKVLTEAGGRDAGGGGVAAPVGRGAPQATASARGYRSWAGSVEIRGGERKTVEIPPLEQEPKEEPKPLPPPPATIVATSTIVAA